MKTILSTKELKQAVAEYVSKTYPALAGKLATITFEKTPLTHNEWAVASNGLHIERQDWIQAVIDCSDA